MLFEASPYKSGTLRGSIQMFQLDANTWQITIGNEGDNTTGKASIEYAHITNDYKTLGKNNVPNRNYHWVNKVLKRWAEENKLQFELEGEDDE